MRIASRLAVKAASGKALTRWAGAGSWGLLLLAQSRGGLPAGQRGRSSAWGAAQLPAPWPPAQARAQAADQDHRRHVPPGAHDHHRGAWLGLPPAAAAPGPAAGTLQEEPCAPRHGASRCSFASCIATTATTTATHHHPPPPPTHPPPTTHHHPAPQVIPFMELALPLLLKLFPNMLPSTFEDKLKQEEELKKRLAVRMQVARFLQDTVAEMANDIRKRSTGEQAATAAELYQFIAKVSGRGAGRARGWPGRLGAVRRGCPGGRRWAAGARLAAPAACPGVLRTCPPPTPTPAHTPHPAPRPQVRAGEAVENDDLIRFASLFNDELTLDNLERLQLVTLCQFVGITPFGTDSFLRGRLRQHLAQIKRDDLDIKAEGLDSLTAEEMRQACRRVVCVWEGSGAGAEGCWGGAPCAWRRCPSQAAAAAALLPALLLTPWPAPPPLPLPPAGPAACAPCSARAPRRT